MQILKSHLLAFSALLPVAALSMTVHAEYTGPTAEGDHTLAQILANPVDDQPVTLSGYLVKKLSYETYVFSDGTDELLAAYGVTELISQATTHHPCCASRVANIQRFAELMQGQVIKPGESLSLNSTVGERTEAKGFVEAGVIVNGELTKDIGGGISQFATTFFQASFYGGLEIDAYFPHTIWFSRYTDFAGRKGIESTISWPSPDVRVRNISPYPILIWPTWTHTSVTVSLYSTNHAQVAVEGQTFKMLKECEVIETIRVRTYPDSSEEFDKFTARYQPENGIDCDGEPTYPRPPDPPVDVTAIAGDQQATVFWGVPEPEGDFDITEYFPIEEYLVTAEPGGGTCSSIPPELTCTVEDLSCPRRRCAISQCNYICKV